MKSKKMRKELKLAIDNCVQEYKGMVARDSVYNKEQVKDVYKDIKALIRTYNYFEIFDNHLYIDAVLSAESAWYSR